MTEEAEKPHYHGHRQRLRERFMAAGSNAVADYELLELLLFPVLPRSDIKPLAKALIERFGNFAGVVNADASALRAMKGLGETSVVSIKVVQAALQRVLQDELKERPVLSSWEKVLNYCKGVMGHSRIEQFRLLFLDRKHLLIADEIQANGTIDHTPVYPREVVKRALDLGAAAIIMVHNHPTGDPTPSKADIEMTREVSRAAAALGVQLHDHLIIGRGGKHVSMKSMALL